MSEWETKSTVEIGTGEAENKFSIVCNEIDA